VAGSLSRGGRAYFRLRQTKSLIAIAMITKGMARYGVNVLCVAAAATASMVRAYLT
jgi:hypothetical protein